MGVNVGLIAAASQQRELERTLECFRVADATAPDRAQTLDNLRLSDTAIVRRLAKAGVLLVGPVPGRMYLSEAAYATYRRGGNKRAVAIALGLGVVLFLFGLIMALTARPGGR
jgi:hypothetical protein